MTDHNSQALPTGESWETYWRGAFCGAAFTSGGITHPTIQSFWDEIFRTARAKNNTPKIIDIASGNGPVVDSAMRAFGGRLPDFTCLDISASAIRILEQRFPTVHTIVADARQIPLQSAGFDIVTSQFGSEYAGLEAMDEVARLVAPGGQLALLLHNRSGSLYRECAASLDAIERIQQAEFVPYAIDMFEKGFTACRGADRTEYDAAAKRLAPAVRELESIMTQHGRHVAGDLVTRLYDDVGTMHEHIQRYEPSEVLNWLNRMQVELQAFAGRMASMCDAAIGSKTFDRICEGLRRQAFTTVRAEALAEPDQPLPLAWALVAIRN
jgi:ubiquinone/menaquinone biosynthesis C-methylase UbiE